MRLRLRLSMPVEYREARKEIDVALDLMPEEAIMELARRAKQNATRLFDAKPEEPK